jgi:hypothetical protein
MGVLSTYDNSQHADLRDEIAAAKSNPLVPSRQHHHFTSYGTLMADPEWDTGPLAPLLETILQESDFGDQYNHLPDKLSQDLYGTGELWLLLLKVNSAMGRHDFVGPRLKYFARESVGTLLQILRFGQERADRDDASGIEAVTDLTVKTVYA